MVEQSRSWSLYTFSSRKWPSSPEISPPPINNRVYSQYKILTEQPTELPNQTFGAGMTTGQAFPRNAARTSTSANKSRVKLDAPSTQEQNNSVDRAGFPIRSTSTSLTPFFDHGARNEHVLR